MAINTGIKIIKKKDLASTNSAIKNETRVKQESARKIVNNVSNWVNELHRRKCDETKQAIDSLFPGRPQADGI